MGRLPSAGGGDLVIEDVASSEATPASARRASRKVSELVPGRASFKVGGAEGGGGGGGGGQPTAKGLLRVMSWEDKQKDAATELKAATRSRDRKRLASAIMHARELGVKGKAAQRALAQAEQALAEVEALAAMALETDALQKRIRESTSREASSRVLDPGSPLMQRWDLGIIGALLFTAVFTPFEVAFGGGGAPAIDALFFANRAVDIAFVTDIAINFNLAFFDPKRGANVRDLRRIRRRYLRSWFAVDLVSTLPFDCAGFFVSGSAGAGTRFLTMLRALKLLKLVRVMRVVRAGRVVDRVQVRTHAVHVLTGAFSPSSTSSRLTPPLVASPLTSLLACHHRGAGCRVQASLNLSNAAVTLLKFLLLVVAVLHWTACLWAFVPTLQSDDAAAVTWRTSTLRLEARPGGGGNGGGGNDLQLVSALDGDDTFSMFVRCLATH